MAEYFHHDGKRYHLIPGIIDRRPFVGTVKILLRPYLQVQRPGLVHCVFHLVDMPVRAEKGRIADSHVCPYPFDFLCIPQRECIVVAVRHQDTVLSDGVEIVPRHLDGSLPVASVMIVPVLLGHQGRNAEAQERNRGCRCRISLP